MKELIDSHVFSENSIELLPAYFSLAEANIGIGGHRLKKAEEFLIAAYWNLLKFTSDKDEKGGQGDSGAEDSLVDDQEIETYRSKLHKTFGRLFMSKNEESALKKAKEEFSLGIYKECIEHGPESIHLCSSYFYMGQIFMQDGSIIKARAYF
jgi:hypothetical protein